MSYLIKLIYWTVTSTLVLLGLLVLAAGFAVSAPFVAVAAAFRWIELQAVYGGDRAARSRAEWLAI